MMHNCSLYAVMWFLPISLLIFLLGCYPQASKYDHAFKIQREAEEICFDVASADCLKEIGCQGNPGSPVAY